jgi:hypothetical protein
LSSFNATVKGFSTTSLPNDKLSQNSPQSTPSSAEVKSFASKSDMLSNRGDPTSTLLPSDPRFGTEKTAISFASVEHEAFSTGSARAILRSELLVGSGSETVIFSQGLELGSKVNEKLIFPAPVKEKLNDSSDISLQNKKNDAVTPLETQQNNFNSPSACYKGHFENASVFVYKNMMSNSIQYILNNLQLLTEEKVIIDRKIIVKLYIFAFK